MTPLIRIASFMAAIVAGACALLILIMAVMPQTGISFFPGFWLTTAALAPMFVARPLGKALWRQRPQVLTGREILTLTAMATVPIAVLGLLTEAAVVSLFLQQDDPLRLQDVLFAPLAERYSVQVIFGLSFFSSLVIAALLSCLIYLPGQLTRQEQTRSRD